MYLLYCLNFQKSTSCIRFPTKYEHLHKWCKCYETPTITCKFEIQNCCVHISPVFSCWIMAPRFFICLRSPVQLGSPGCRYNANFVPSDYVHALLPSLLITITTVLHSSIQKDFTRCFPPTRIKTQDCHICFCFVG